MNGYDSGHGGGYGRGRSDRGGSSRGGPRGGYGRGGDRGGFQRRHEECPPELRAPFKEARDFVAGLIHAFGLPARLSFGGLEQARDGRQVVIDVRGLRPNGPPRGYDRDAERDDELGLLIGKHGNMLDALTVVTNAVMHRVGDREVFFAVDVEGYRARRRATLRGIALRAAERALHDGVDVELEPMPPSERRIIHMTLAAHRDLATESTGIGLDRRVVIIVRRGGRDERGIDDRPRDDRSRDDRGPVDRGPVDRGPVDRPRDDRGPRGRRPLPIRDDDGPPRDDRYAD